MRLRRNFGTMRQEWQDRNAKDVRGFDVTLADGFKFRHEGGCMTIPDEYIQDHGPVKKAVPYA